jgi:hypothetical protein
VTTLDEIDRLARNLHAADPSLRKGQAAYNALYRLDPVCAQSVHDTAADPFFLDEALPAFWTCVGAWIGAKA